MSPNSLTAGIDRSVPILGQLREFSLVEEEGTLLKFSLVSDAFLISHDHDSHTASELLSRRWHLRLHHSNFN